MPSRTYNQNEEVTIKHKETGKEYTSRGTDYFSFDDFKFDVLVGDNLSTREQREELRDLMQLNGKDIVQLLDKYNKRTLKEFSRADMDKLIGFLK